MTSFPERRNTRVFSPEQAKKRDEKVVKDNQRNQNNYQFCPSEEVPIVNDRMCFLIVLLVSHLSHYA